jgi:hypothetical protein
MIEMIAQQEKIDYANLEPKVLSKLSDKMHEYNMMGKAIILQIQKEKHSINELLAKKESLQFSLEECRKEQTPVITVTMALHDIDLLIKIGKRDGAEFMGYQVCGCGKPIIKSVLRNGLVAFYDNKGNNIKNCSYCGEELKELKSVN